MADHFISVNKQAALGDGGGSSTALVTAGTSTSGQAIELRMLDGAALDKKSVLMALEAFKAWIQNSGNTVTP